MLLTKALMYSARTFPGKKAILDGKYTFTYSQFATRAAKVKRSLSTLGVKKGDRVAFLMFNSYHYLELMYGVMARGGILVPLNNRLSVEEISFILNDATAEVLYIHKEFLSIVSELKRNVKSLRHIILADDIQEIGEMDGILQYEELLATLPEEEYYAEGVEEGDIAGIYYTGGTTGRPKGVMLTHKNLVMNSYQNLVAFHIPEKEEIVYLHAAPIFHLADGAQTFNFMFTGATHVIIRSFSSKGVLESIQNFNVTTTLLVPAMINMLLNDPDFDNYDTSSLRRILYGASPISKELLTKSMKKMPKTQFIQLYGMTEASPLLMVLSPEDHVINGTEQETKRLTSCGRPVPIVELKLVDSNGDDVPVNEVGEIIFRGPNIMKGYWNLPQETAKAIRNGWYFTGDLAYKDEEGYYYMVDRAKDMIITGGENVYSVEVENVLYQHPSILECAVIGVPDEKWGEAVKAIVVRKQGYQVTEEEILSFVRKKLANYKVPKTIDFVPELPKSGAGKILKRELREQYWVKSERRVN
jgi:long-chain acyl-CoA synthetase